MSKARTSKTIGYIQIMAINIVILGVMLVVIEGLSSYVLMAYDMRTKRPIAERRHTKYDPDLGSDIQVMLAGNGASATH